MIQCLYSLTYDILAYLVAACSLVDEILYKLGFKRRIDVFNDLPKNLSSKLAIVTGGTRGLGLTTVRTLLAKGCSVFVASSQTQDKFPQIKAKIYHGVPDTNEETKVRRGKVYLHYLDLSSMDSVIEFVKAFKRSGLPLNYLICNAAIMFAPRKITIDNFESHFAINYLGHCLLILELLPELERTSSQSLSESRIVSVSSSTHRITGIRFDDLLGAINYSSSQAYAQSKLAQIMFTAHLAEVLNEKRFSTIKCFSLHPGVVLSELYEHVNLISYFPFLIPLIKLVTRDIVQGAETTLYAALSSELENKTGYYLEDCNIKKLDWQLSAKAERIRLWNLTMELLSKWFSPQTREFVQTMGDHD